MVTVVLGQEYYRGLSSLPEGRCWRKSGPTSDIFLILDYNVNCYLVVFMHLDSIFWSLQVSQLSSVYRCSTVWTLVSPWSLILSTPGDGWLPPGYDLSFSMFSFPRLLSRPVIHSRSGHVFEEPISIEAMKDRFVSLPPHLVHVC